MDISTLLVHGSAARYDVTGAVSVPIFQTSTFAHPGVGESTGYDYSRSQNPTREYLEQTLAALERGSDAMAFSSGMAAETALMELLSPGDCLLASDDLYGGTRRLFDNISSKNGVVITYVNTSDLNAVLDALTERTRMVYIETPTNPMMRVADIKAIAEMAHEHKALLAVDNTFLTPYYQRPLTLGADIVIHSGTKFLAGHNDTLAGFIVTANAELSERLRLIYKTTGACLAPFDSWLLIRGIKTLAVRMDRQSQSALEIARWLETNPNVRAVHYVGLPSHPNYELSKRQSDGFGSMISFEVRDEATARRVLNSVKIIQYAESLGGVESLITYPMLQTHADVPESVRETLGVNSRLLRLSVGLEDAHDLIRDLAAALGE
jgi:cystathionine beta-lyase/cystathionine gamma-synthase